MRHSFAALVLVFSALSTGPASPEFAEGSRPSIGEATYGTTGEGSPPGEIDPFDNQHPSFGPDGRVYFRTDRSGNPDIHRMAPDGTCQEPFVTSGGDEYPPSWAPDGSLGAFMSDRSGDWEIYSIGPSGGTPARLTESEGRDWDPALSPNGARIAFMREEDPGDADSWQIWEMERDGSGARPLLTGGTPNFYPRYLSGGGLLFVSRRTGTSRVLVMDSVGGAVRSLEEGEMESFTPEISPDGRTVLFGTRRHGSLDLYRIELDGTGLRRLTDDPGREMYGVWSPDGEWILFGSNRSGHFEIYRMRPDGTGVEQVTDQEGSALRPGGACSGSGGA